MTKRMTMEVKVTDRLFCDNLWNSPRHIGTVIVGNKQGTNDRLILMMKS